MREQKSNTVAEKNGFEGAVLLALNMEGHKPRNIDDL